MLHQLLQCLLQLKQLYMSAQQMHQQMPAAVATHMVLADTHTNKK
jgi:hypothetical protein